MAWKPQLDAAVDVSKLDLDAQEGFLLSRLDGSTSVDELPFLTGLPRERVEGILDRLVSMGTVARSEPAGRGARAAEQPAPVAESAPGQLEEPDVEFEFDLEEVGLEEAGLDFDDAWDAVESGLAESPVADESGDADCQGAVSGAAVPEVAVSEDAMLEAATSEPEADDEPTPGSAGASEDESDALGPVPGADANWRALFERELKPLEVDARVERARHASGDHLNAFCYDPSPRVISALTENQGFGLEHARRVAANHRTGGGLDAIGRRQQFLRDRQVQRNLFRNNQAPQALLLRIFQAYRLAEIFRLTAGREATERVRSVAKKQFRSKFPQSSAEERVQLILKTEGRCLPQLVGVALGGRATALLCRRPLVSTLLIRNLARWPSTPPPVLQHMARQPSVRRSPMLRNEILRHPNAPSRLQAELRS